MIFLTSRKAKPMRSKPHDWFFYALCSGLGLLAGIVLLLSLMATPRAYAQEGGCFKTVDVMAMLTRDSIPFDVYQDAGEVERGIAKISEAASFPIEKDADAILIVKTTPEPQVSVSFAGVVCGRILVTKLFARDLKAAILGKANTRDA